MPCNRLAFRAETDPGLDVTGKRGEVMPSFTDSYAFGTVEMVSPEVLVLAPGDHHFPCRIERMTPKTSG